VESARATPSSPAKGTAGANGKDVDREAATESRLDEDDALALLASEHALGLPQLAIQIAAQAAAVQSTDAKSLPLTESAGKTARTASSLAAALAAGNPQAKTPALAIQENPAAGPGLPAKDRGISADAGTGLLEQANSTLQQGLAENGKTIAARPARQASDATQALSSSQTSEPGKPKTAAADFLVTLANAAQGSKNEPAIQIDVMGANQAAALAAAAATSSPASPHPANASIGMLNTVAQAALPDITSPLPSAQWASDFGRQFMSLTQGGHSMPHTAELRLDPPELGPLRITINISDNIAHAMFVSPHAAVRQTVENALPQLQQLLAQAGISLGQTSVNDQGQPGQSFNESANGQGTRSSAARAAAGSTGSTGNIAAMPAARTLAPNALVDTFA
jgi:flagellar hook-length control protein FliK